MKLIQLLFFLLTLGCINYSRDNATDIGTQEYLLTQLLVPTTSVTGRSPTITSFSPSSGSVGTTVIITGTNFSTSTSSNTVKFNSTTATVTGSTATSITTTVPSGATSGTITVTVGGLTATSSSRFTVSTVASVSNNFDDGVVPSGWSGTWTNTSVSCFSGNCLKSATIGNSASSSITVTKTTNAGSITFYRNVSSESGHDYCIFYVDSVETNSNRVSGSGSWTFNSYTVTAGSHTFLWTYSKDISIASGSDACWIDSVTFP
ncbi:hypothetical protein EHQ58_05935 [Leptospira ognonensis]|uniref:IPT/TIG domain-containing protein n=1 Tax=Leptospira ognonensis TaxID=2484945 RepID=A0A4V3JRQ9_9LEPT|nr:IPT/TIG domain-containing protein [Leptospira ognonensis]TGL61315.1 hypothetical protein EHQ58_05935 [Leptospira ognonensis]